MRHVFQPHRCAVAVGHDQRFVFFGREQLVGRIDRPASPCIGNLSLGTIGVRLGQSLADFFQTNAEMVEHRRIEIDSHRGRRPAAYVYIAYAADLRQLLLDNRRGRVVHRRHVVSLARERQQHDRRIGGIDLTIGRRAGQVGGQTAAGGVDGRLHVARGGIDVAIEVELQRNGRRTQVTGRRHLRHAGNPAELPLQRRGDGRSHRLRTGAGQHRRDLNRGKIDLRQRRHRQ